MVTLTTRQRDILKVILDVNRPISSTELATRLNLTPRQVNYSLKGVRIWLKENNRPLEVVPGAGFALPVTQEQARQLSRAMSAQGNIQIILSVSQRQQLLALFLLSNGKPYILSQLEQLAQVSRVTVLKDLDHIEPWLKERQITLVRKPHFGIQVEGAEHHLQQALAEVIWGETSFSQDPVAEISHADGLVFNLRDDARLLPLVESANRFLDGIPLRRIINLVTKAEEQLGGRFTDDAVLHLALVFGILSERVSCRYHLQVEASQIEWLQTLATWPVAEFVAKGLAAATRSIFTSDDIAGIAMHMMAAPRNELMPGELERNGGFSVLIKRVLEAVSEGYHLPQLKHDRILADGLATSIITAHFRQRFQLWFPKSLHTASLPEQHEQEYSIAHEISRIVFDHHGLTLPQNEINNLVVLLHTAYIRNRSYRFERIIVVCPSGMATAQLLVARLLARFPYLNKLEVISLRDLSPVLVSAADLTLTTVPLPRQYASHPKVIQVHPLLMPEDIEKITNFLV